MSARNLICIVVDRLHAGMVGAYGNSWIRTPQFDRLACESFVFDQAFCDSVQLSSLYRAYWQNIDARGLASEPAGLSLPHVLTATGMQTVLMTDEPEVMELTESAQFTERVWIESPSSESASAGGATEDASETHIARIFERATDWLQTAQQPFCLWLHVRGMAGEWDAPWEFRNQYAEDEDPPPPTFTEVPNEELSEGFDPDHLLGVTHAYAGQVSLLDACLGAFYDEFRAGPLAATTHLTFLSARGFPLGEHLRIGKCDESLFNELVQLAWLMRFPDGLGALARSRALVVPSDLPGTLLSAVGIEPHRLGSAATTLLQIVTGERDGLRDRILLRSGVERALRTPAWHLRRRADGVAELYAKPGDRWEVNEVANLCPDVVAGLTSALQEMDAPVGESPLAPLPEVLVTEID